MSDRGILGDALKQQKKKQSLPEPAIEPPAEVIPEVLPMDENTGEETPSDESAGVISHKPEEWTEPVPDPVLDPIPDPACDPQADPELAPISALAPEETRDTAPVQVPQQYSMYALSIDNILPGLHGGVQVVYTALDHVRMSFLCHSIQSIVPVPEMKNPQLRRVSLIEKARELIGVDEQKNPVAMSEQEWNMRLLHYVLPEVERMRKEWIGETGNETVSPDNPVYQFFFGGLFRDTTQRESVIAALDAMQETSSAWNEATLISHETASAVVVAYVA